MFDVGRKGGMGKSGNRNCELCIKLLRGVCTLTGPVPLVHEICEKENKMLPTISIYGKCLQIVCKNWLMPPGVPEFQSENSERW